jgi:hypothetical protein
MITRSEVIGLCRQEAHANLQRHIKRGGHSGPISRSYVVHHSPLKSRPPTFWEILIVGALAMLKIGG